MKKFLSVCIFLYFMLPSIGLCEDTLIFSQEGCVDNSEIDNQEIIDELPLIEILLNNENQKQTNSSRQKNIKNLSGQPELEQKKLFIGANKTTNLGFRSISNSSNVYTEYMHSNFSLKSSFTQSATSSLQNNFKFEPQFKLTDTIFLNTRYSKNLNTETQQGTMGLCFKPKKNANDLLFELGASSYFDGNRDIRQKIEVTTKFKI